jgi:hypothetical protein
MKTNTMTPLLFYKLRWAAINGTEDYYLLRQEWARSQNQIHRIDTTERTVEDYRKIDPFQNPHIFIRDYATSAYVTGWIDMVKRFLE